MNAMPYRSPAPARSAAGLRQGELPLDSPFRSLAPARAQVSPGGSAQRQLRAAFEVNANQAFSSLAHQPSMAS